MSTQVHRDSSIDADLPAGAPHILVVDDDPFNLKAMEVALEGLRCEQIRVGSGEAALRELLRRDFSLILLDVQMPGLDGFETARLIRNRKSNRDIPIIFVTAFSQDDSDMRKGYELGAVDYLFKPIVPEVLRAKVRAFVELRERTLEVKRQARQLQAMHAAEAEHRLQEERRKWEAEVLRVQNQQLADADRKKDEFLAVLAHELRNPLAPLANGLELIAQSDGVSPKLAAVHRVMERQVRHLTRLVDDLLDVSRISRGKLELHMETTNLDRAVEHALDACRARLEDQAQTVHLKGADEPVILRSDPVRLTQVLVNLMNNASRYSKKGGNIYVEWGANADQAFVAVRDEGRGIAPEARERIFDMFVQEREGGRGLGLGLTLVKQIVEMHQGTVSVQSEGLGKGSEFRIEIPRTDGVLPEDESPQSYQKSDPANEYRLRIALVEDDDDIRETMAALLEQWGHIVEVAADGIEGVQLVTRMRPDVALFDLGLPRLDGHSAASAICEEMGDERPPLIALSGYGQTKDLQRSKEAGFDLHLVKPAEPKTLQQALFAISQRKKWPARQANEKS